ncbi:hypothetical protein [Nocardioides sp. YIM 152315]|uniref:hypothetical protein n=1 Tax=Nocardioides sp. YIM 152315 TaxID=3031760 RepID=UPI0023DA980E|nr:hypothetical protein [Nocardioides sp. YIM 152315]MDF1605017.1 hypothetical protein [Nocardioides sp. YIM 152315]
MITDASDFRPLVARRLVPTGPGVELDGPGTRFCAGQLVEESEAPTTDVGALVLLQLAARKR